MATTESRTGFRLPWAGDRRDETNDPEDESQAAALEAGTAEAGGDGTTPTADAADDSTTSTATEGAPEAMTETMTGSVAPSGTAAVSAQPAAPSAPAVGPSRKPTKFLADLTKAMQAAAEAERQETLEIFQLEAKSFVETIHGRSATEAEELRKQADEDIAAIRDWSKQEIARIREETETRISARKTDLTEEIDAHAARIEREIERVHATVERYEQEMAAFFEKLLGESDPTRFAAMAASLPEPPSFEAVVAGTQASSPSLSSTTAEATDVADTPSEPTTAEATEPADAADATPPTAELSATDREAAFAAIEAAARAAETTEAAGPTNEPVAEAEAPADADTSAGEDVQAEPEVAAEPVAEAASGSETADPRLAVLGLADFASAEAEASADLPTDVESIPELGDDLVAARLADLVPEDGQPTPDATEPTSAETSVFVTGLVSVASIASFKRQLGRTPGVHSVGVSSGPDGEFVFAVAHDPGLDVTATVTTLPGFGARVTDTTDGVVRATAHDAEAGA